MIPAAWIGDDQHAPGDNAYTSVMRARKWLLLSAAFFYVVHETQFSPQPFSILIGRAIIDLATLQAGAKLGLLYSATMYGLKMLGLMGGYGAVFAERVGERHRARRMRLERELALRHAELDDDAPANLVALFAHGVRPSRNPAQRVIEIESELARDNPEDGPSATVVERISILLQDALATGSPLVAVGVVIF